MKNLKERTKKAVGPTIWVVAVKEADAWTDLYFFLEKTARIYFESYLGTKVQPKEIPVIIEAFSPQSPKKYFLLDKKGKKGKEITGIRRF